MYFYVMIFVTAATFLGCTSDSNTNQSSVVETQAVAVSSSGPNRWVTKNLGHQEDLATIQFIDQFHGWVVSRKGQIHSTSDGGKTWRQRLVDIPQKAEVLASFFVDSLTGWISVVRMGDDVLQPNETKAWLMKTEDGGNTWVAQYSLEALQLDRMRFVSAQEGWAVGSRTVKRETLQNDPFVLHSVDGGKHWAVISGALPKHDGFLEDAHYDKSLGLLVLNSEGQVFSTSNAGAQWQELTAIPNEPSQTFFGRFGFLADRRLWFLGGSSSYEGTYGILAFRKPDNTWTKLRTRAYLSDVIFLTADQIISCGFVYENSGKRGVILRSRDGGRSWVTDIPTNTSPPLTALARAGNHIWVVGEHGYVALLEDL